MKPRLIFAANRRIGSRGLELLYGSGWEPIALIVPNGDQGEYSEEMKSMVAGSVPVLEGEAFREPDGIALLSALRPDYLLAIHFPYVFPKSVLSIPSIGSLNLHPALLPFNRGWHTPSWSILDETPYGATLHWITPGLDDGDIAIQREMSVRPDDTADMLYKRILDLEHQLLVEAMPLMLERSLPRIPQVQLNATMHKKKDLAAVMRMDLDERLTVGETLRKLRALTTDRWAEAAFFEEGGRRYRVRIEIRPEQDDGIEP